MDTNPVEYLLAKYPQVGQPVQASTYFVGPILSLLDPFLGLKFLRCWINNAMYTLPKCATSDAGGSAVEYVLHMQICVGRSRPSSLTLAATYHVLR